MKTQIENPNGLHQRYVIRKLVKKERRINHKGKVRMHHINEIVEVEVEEDAEYFVLRLDMKGLDINHIKACRIGVHAYAGAIESTIPQLAKDLRERYPLI